VHFGADAAVFTVGDNVVKARLGPMGGRIVGEVMRGVLQLDPHACVSVRTDWRPTLPSRFAPGEFHMVDLLTFARVVPRSHGQ
jgi:hypothetical protein